MNIRSSGRHAQQVLILVLSLMITNVLVAEEGPWAYKLGHQRVNQQANFCLTLDATLQIAEIFATHGARPGYSALDQSQECELQVLSFTPIGIVRSVTVAKGEENQYDIHFVEVSGDMDDTLYMVTTRKVSE